MCLPNCTSRARERRVPCCMGRRLCGRTSDCSTSPVQAAVWPGRVVVEWILGSRMAQGHAVCVGVLQ